MNRALDIAVAIPILIGATLTGIVSLVAAGPAICLAVYRVEHVMSEAREHGDGPW